MKTYCMVNRLKKEHVADYEREHKNAHITRWKTSSPRCGSRSGKLPGFCAGRFQHCDYAVRRPGRMPATAGPKHG